MSSPSQPASPSVQRKPVTASTTSTAPPPQITGTEKAASSSIAPPPQNTAAEKAASSSTVTPDALENFLEWTLKVLGFAAAYYEGLSGTRDA